MKRGTWEWIGMISSSAAAGVTLMFAFTMESQRDKAFELSYRAIDQRDSCVKMLEEVTGGKAQFPQSGYIALQTDHPVGSEEKLQLYRAMDGIIAAPVGKLVKVYTDYGGICGRITSIKPMETCDVYAWGTLGESP